jgi:hypothetical protein
MSSSKGAASAGADLHAIVVVSIADPHRPIEPDARAEIFACDTVKSESVDFSILTKIIRFDSIDFVVSDPGKA